MTHSSTFSLQNPRGLARRPHERVAGPSDDERALVGRVSDFWPRFGAKNPFGLRILNYKTIWTFQFPFGTPLDTSGEAVDLSSGTGPGP